jgi:hypothetical protein
MISSDNNEAQLAGKGSVMPVSAKERKKLSLSRMAAGYYERGDSAPFTSAARNLLI